MRNHALKRRLQHALPRTMDAALDKLVRPPITNARTIQRMAFCPAAGEWKLGFRE